MVLKLRFAVSLALLVGVFTVFSGFGNAARPTTVLYRAAVSMFLFAIVGFGVGMIWERFLRDWLERLNQSEEDNGEAISADENEVVLQAETETIENGTAENIEFDELTPEQFETMTHPKE